MEFWIVLLTVWSVYRWVHGRMQRQRDAEEIERLSKSVSRLESRNRDLAKLETRVDELARKLDTASAERAGAPAASRESAKPAEARVPMRAEGTPEIAKASPAPATPSEPDDTAAVKAAPPPPAVKPSAPQPIAAATEPSAVPRWPGSPRQAPPPLSPPPRPAPVSARELSAQLEETLGTNWLNKLGIIALVIGIALFLAYKFPSLSNAGKVGLGYVVSALILGTGIYLERSDRYRLFSRALIGGGWALTFFVTYAMHFVPYTRVIDRQWIDLVLLLAVAAAMVAHTLRYDSQVVTGLAFLLAFTTVAISQNTIYSLSAGSILALGLVAIVHRRKWFALEVFGILASYGNHFIWLASVIVPLAGRHRMFPEFVPSTVLLCLYWGTYRWSYIARQIEDANEERISTAAAILNTALLLMLFKYQSVRPELAFYALLILGAAEFALGQLAAARRRRAAFTILSVIGIVLVVAAIPFRYSGMDTAIIWLAEAQTLMLAGVLTREILFRRFGLLVAVLTAGDMLVKQAVPTLYSHLLHTPGPMVDLFTWSEVASRLQLAVSFFVAALLFYGNSLALPRRWKDLIVSENERRSFRGLSYLAAVMLFVSVWFAFSVAWIAVLWMAAASLLVILGRAYSERDLSSQAHFYSLAAVCRAFAVNYYVAGSVLRNGISLRLVTFVLIITLLYLCAGWIRERIAEQNGEFSWLYTTAAAALVVALIYRECHWAWVGVGWGCFAVVLAIRGIFGKRRDLSLQAHAIVFAGFVRTLLVNLEATEEWHQLTTRFITFTLMAGILYLCAYFSGPRDADYARRFSTLHTWAGSLLVAVLAFKEVSSPWIAVAWAAFALLLLATGTRLKQLQLHFQAHVLSACALFQIASVNIEASGSWSVYPRISLRLVTIAMVAVLFYLCGRWAAKGEYAQAPFAGGVYSWAASSLVVTLLYYELAPVAVALGWCVAGLALFEIGVWRRSANWRLQSYVAFGLSFYRIADFNLAGTGHELLLWTLPTAAIFYCAYARLKRLTASLEENAVSGHPAGDGPATAGSFAVERQFYVAEILAYLGSATLALFGSFYFHDGEVLIAWAMLSFLFLGVAWARRREVFNHHSLILAIFVFARGFSYELVAWGQTHPSWKADSGLYISVAAGILFAAQVFAFPLRARLNALRATSGAGDHVSFDLSSVLRRQEQIYFFLPMALVTFLILNEVSPGRVTIGWGIEAVAAFLFALMVSERSFRLSGLGLLLVCVGKIVALDVWRQERSDRFITFIILGVALLLVSYLYTRYSEAIRRYL